MSQKVYANLIDAFLDDRAPDWVELGLEDAKASGEEQLDRTHDYVDKAFLDDIAEGASHHTQITGPKTSAAKPVSSAAAERQARLEAARTGAQRSDSGHSGFGGYIAPNAHMAASPNDYKADHSDESLFAEVTFSLTKARGVAELKTISDREIKNYVGELLNQGETPTKVAAALKKLAEVALFNHNMAQEYLNNNAGFLGLAYIEPNQYMQDCNKTHERLNVRASKIRAASVKQVNACEGCTFFKKDASGAKTCNLYHLPIVSSVEEIRPVVNKLTAGVPKEQKRAALVKIANRENQLVQVATKSEMVSRAPEHVDQVAKQAERRTQKQARTVDFNGSMVAKMHHKGASLERIYQFGVSKVGSVQASKGVREFISTLKQKGTKVALSQVDCTFLKNKLGEHNMIVGAHKCGSCSFRSDMHCGMTGGTLLSFPGMDKAASNHKIAAGAPSDGYAMLKEFEMDAPQEGPSFEISGPNQLDVSTDSTFKIDLE